ncbi:MAG: SMC-Scp complex subunit ScpB [Candidatus Falkowbacteria bacterium]|nr:SMC-Scp complex subunit ScpB [Candidatus Falkowbacteria bacterium]
MKSSLESLLFVAAKPLKVKDLADLVKKSVEEVTKALDELALEYETTKRGMEIIKQGSTYQMVTAPSEAALIKEFVKDETMGELSKPSVEALTIIAYRGPISKTDLDRIRGVNCALILRNLLLHGLIEAKVDKKKDETYYTVTLDFVRFLGIKDIADLPDYARLSVDDSLDRMLATPEVIAN